MAMMRQMENHPLEEVLIAEIDLELQPWHVRRMPARDDIVRLAGAIGTTGYITPVRLIRTPRGYQCVSGILRILAARELGHTTIPALVSEAGNDAHLLLLEAFADQDATSPPSELERAWALAQLQQLLRERNEPFRNVDIAALTGLDKGTVSSALKAASALPEHVVRQVATHHGIDPEAIVRLPREPLRRIARASPEDRRALVEQASREIRGGRKPGRAVMEATQVQMEDGVTRERPSAPVGPRPLGRRGWCAVAWRWWRRSIRRVRRAIRWIGTRLPKRRGPR
jgi:hypothetical protein